MSRASSSWGLANFAQAEQGNPKIAAIEAIAFGPDGLLLVGSGARVFSIDTGDARLVPWSNRRAGHSYSA